MKVTPETLTDEQALNAVACGLVSQSIANTAIQPADSIWRTVAREMVCDLLNARAGAKP